MRLGLLSALFMMAATAAGAAELPSNVVIKVGLSATSSYDLVSRVVAAHLGQFLPGHPSIDVETVDGGAGMQLLRQMVETEPHDGSVLGAMGVTLVKNYGLDPSTFDFSPKGLNWVGALAKTVTYCVRKAGTPVQLTDDGLVIGTLSKTTFTYAYASLLKHLVNPKAELVVGFKTENELMAALDRGEIQLYCGPARSTYEREGRQSTQEILGGVGSDESLAALKLNNAFGTEISELDRKVIGLALSSSLFYNFALPAGTDAEIVKAYRDAFVAMNADPAFRTEITAKVLEYAPSTGEEVQAFLQGIFDTDPAVLARATELLK